MDSALTVGDLYEEFQDDLRAYAARLTRDRQAADDLVQEAFVRALGHVPLLQQLRRPQRQAWLHLTARRLYLDHCSARLREEALLARLACEADAASGTAEPIAPEVAADLLARLPQTERELLTKRYLVGMTSQELAAQLGVAPGTVRYRLHLAIQKLRHHHGSSS